MRDFVLCEWPLPDVSFQNKLFETASLGNQGLRYTITKQGRLVRHLSEEMSEYRGPCYTEDVELPIHGELRLTSRWTSVSEPKLSVVFRFREGIVQWVRYGLLTFEHQGCPVFEYEYDDEGSHEP